MAQYSEFEQEIRHPGEGLMKAIDEIRHMEFDDPRRPDWDVVKQTIDKGIEQDLGWTRQNIEEYFNIYSDCHKDAYGFRPRWDFTSDYYDTLYIQMVLQHKDETGYGDYTHLQEEIDRQEAYEQEQFDQNMDGVTLNGEKPDMRTVEDKVYEDEDQAIHEQCLLDDAADEEDDEIMYKVHHAGRLQRRLSATVAKDMAAELLAAGWEPEIDSDDQFYMATLDATYLLGEVGFDYGGGDTEEHDFGEIEVGVDDVLLTLHEDGSAEIQFTYMQVDYDGILSHEELVALIKDNVLPYEVNEYFYEAVANDEAERYADEQQERDEIAYERAQERRYEMERDER